MRKQGSCLEKEVTQGTMPGVRRRGRPRTAWMDNITTWTGLTMEESIRMAEINGESTFMVWRQWPIDNYIKYSLDFLRPIRTAEAFEAVDWLADLPNEHGRKHAAGRVTSF